MCNKTDMAQLKKPTKTQNLAASGQVSDGYKDQE